MKPLKKTLIVISLFGILILDGISVARACTMCMTSKGGAVIAGNNEDWSDPLTHMWFEPAQDGKFGRVYFGFGDFFPQGGMNDRGLCFDGFTTPTLEVTESANLPIYPGNLLDGVMAECATVDEAMAFFRRYNLRGLRNAQLMFVDKNGASAIIEGDQIIYKEGNYQVCTNFYHSNRSLGGWPCWRYNTASEMLAVASGYTIELFRSILDATHQEGAYPTQYSNIYDLTNGTSYLYYRHNFDEVITFNLKEELKKGSKRYLIPSLFSNLQTSYPQDGEVLGSTTVDFLWNGEAKVYQLYCSNSSDFSDCEPIDVKLSKTGFLSAGVTGSMLIVMFFWGRVFRFKLVFLVVVFTAGLILVISCSGDKIISPEGQKEITYSIENLRPNTTYYWKVVAQATPDFKSESVVKTFRTGS